MQTVAIVAMCIGSAVVYGILHDQVTARVCVEYFMIGHEPLFDTESPTLLGLGWGIVATWWAGLLLGIPLAIAARAGQAPKRDVRSVATPIATLLVGMALCALAAGIAGYTLSRLELISLPEPFFSSVSPDRHTRFMADAWAHSASYLVGFAGGITVIALVWRSRREADR